MSARRAMLMAAMVTAVVAGQALAKDAYVYGPEPDWSRYKALAEPAIRFQVPKAKLGDPANWSIEWPNGYARIGWRHKGRFDGYLTCGYLRPIAPVNGRYRIVNFVAVIDRGEVKKIDISGRESNSGVNVMCGYMVCHGTLPPARLMDAPRDLYIATLGMTIRAMPEGAYVVSAAAGSRAANAGLKPAWCWPASTGSHSLA